MKFKKNKGYIISFAVGATLTFSFQSYAADNLKSISAYISSSLNITLDGKTITLDKPVLNYEGSNYINIRDISKVSGQSVSWNANTQTVEMISVINNDNNVSPTPNESVGETDNITPTPTVTPSPTTSEYKTVDWIGLRDLAEQYGVQVNIDSNSIFHLSGKISISLPASTIVKNDGIITVSTEVGDISINLINNLTYFDLNQLKYYGIVD